MKYLTISLLVILSFCFGILAERYYLADISPRDKVHDDANSNVTGFTRSGPNRGPLTPGEGAHDPVTAPQPERMAGHVIHSVNEGDIHKQELDVIVSAPEPPISSEHNPYDASQFDSEPTTYELRRDYEAALIDSGVSRAEAARMADSFVEQIDLVNEMVENDLREWYESNGLRYPPLDN